MDLHHTHKHIHTHTHTHTCTHAHTHTHIHTHTRTHTNSMQPFKYVALLPPYINHPHSPTLPQAVLLQELREVERLLKRESSLPLNPAVRVKGLNLDKCSFFSSFTVPLKLSFKCGEGRPDMGVIFKVGVGHSGINTHVVRCYCTWSTC